MAKENVFMLMDLCTKAILSKTRRAALVFLSVAKQDMRFESGMCLEFPRFNK